jgi:hypothetical protein
MSSPVELATKLFALKARAAGERAKVKATNEEIDRLEAELLGQLTAFPEPERRIRCASGDIAAVWKSRATLEDNAAFRDFVLRTKALDLFENRVSQAAVRERWEAGDKVPGVARQDYLDLSYSGAKGGNGE